MPKRDRERRDSGLLPCCPLFPCSVVGCSRAHPPAPLARAPSLYRPSLALSAVCLRSVTRSPPPPSFSLTLRFGQRRGSKKAAARSFTALAAAAAARRRSPPPLARFSPRMLGMWAHYTTLAAFFGLSATVQVQLSLSLSIPSESLLPSFVGCHWEAPRPRPCGLGEASSLAPSVLGRRRRLLHHQTRQQLTTTESERAESPSCAGAFPERNRRMNGWRDFFPFLGSKFG